MSFSIPIAASNASQRSKDYALANGGMVCDGVADEAEINAAVAALPDSAGNEGGAIALSEGMFNFTDEVPIQKCNVSIVGVGGSYSLGGPEPSFPQTGGTVIKVGASFLGEFAFRFQPSNPTERSLYGCLLRDLSIDGYAGGPPYVNASGVLWGAAISQMNNVNISRFGLNGLVLDGGGSTVYPLGAWDNQFYDLKLQDCGNDLLQCLAGSSDNIFTGCKFVGETTGSRGRYGAYVDASPGNQFLGCHFFYLKDVCLRSNARMLQVNACRFTNVFRGAVLIDGTAAQGGGFNLAGLSLRDVNMSGDAAVDAITVNPSGIIRGGIIDDVTLLATNDAYRPRHLVNVGANMEGLVIGKRSLGYVSPATSALTGETINDSGIATKFELSGSSTYDPPSLAKGASTTTTVTMTGAASNDFVLPSFSLDLQGVDLTAWVSSANVVTFKFQNDTSGTVNLGSGTLKVLVLK